MHAFSLIRNHFHLVLETPNANLVAGMQWLLSTCTLRLNHRRKLTGHRSSGRYKALLVDGSGNGYLKTVCNYVHLNSARAGILQCEERLLAYPWSSLRWYLIAREHRPLRGSVPRDCSARTACKPTPPPAAWNLNNLEALRRAEADDDVPDLLENDWCFGSDEFRARMLEQMESILGENHSRELIRQSAEAKAERIIAEELQRAGWTQADLVTRLKRA